MNGAGKSVAISQGSWAQSRTGVKGVTGVEEGVKLQGQ